MDNGAADIVMNIGNLEDIASIESKQMVKVASLAPAVKA